MKIPLALIFVLLFIFPVFGQKKKIIKKSKPQNPRIDSGRTAGQMANILRKLSVTDKFVYKYDKSKDESSIGFQSSEKEINTEFKGKNSSVFYKVFGVFIFNGKILKKPPLDYYLCFQTDSRKFYFEESYISAWALADENRILFGKADANLDMSETPTVNDNLELNIRYKYKPCWIVKYNDFAKLGSATNLEFKVGSLEFEADYDDLRLFRQFR